MYRLRSLITSLFGGIKRLLNRLMDAVSVEVQVNWLMRAMNDALDKGDYETALVYHEAIQEITGCG